MGTILLVDDEEAITRSLSRALRKTGHIIHSVTSGDAALELLSREPVDMIISDMLMPRMNGYELLSEVKKRRPSVIRVVLSGYTDTLTVVKTIADGTARSFLMKPCENEALREHVEYLFRLERRLHERHITTVLEAIQALPTLPHLYQRLIGAIQDGASMEQVAAIVGENPSYAVQILRIVNSSFHAVHIGSIKSACVYLGLDTLKNIILSTEVFRFFQGSDGENREIARLWRHSGLTNRIFHSLFTKIHGVRVPDDYSCCGLLHDVGLLVMIRYLPDRYAGFMSSLRSGHPPDDNLPAAGLPPGSVTVTHAELGAALLDMWNLPYALVETCLFHHAPAFDSITNKEICALVHIADNYSWQYMEHLSSPPDLDLSVFGHLPLDREKTETAAADILADLAAEEDAEPPGV